MDGRAIQVQVSLQLLANSYGQRLLKVKSYRLVFVPASQAAMAKHGFGGLGEALMEQLLNDVCIVFNFKPFRMGLITTYYNVGSGSHSLGDCTESIQCKDD